MSAEYCNHAAAGQELALATSLPGLGGCGGSTDVCSWSYSGSTGMAVHGQAGPTDVVVGFEVYYYPPYWYRPPAASPNRCLAVNDYLFASTRQGAALVEMPGAVLGVSKLLCADAELVALGSNAPDPEKTVELNFAPPAVPNANVQSATLTAPVGAYALDGARVVYADGGAVQLAASYRPFARNVSSRDRGLTSFLPPQAGSTARTQTADIGCYSSGNDLYLCGLAEAPTEAPPTPPTPPGFVPQLGMLGVACSGYTDLFQMPGAKKVKCCLGEQPWRCWGYDPQSKKCDQTMTAYCQPLCAGGVCTDPGCGCLGSPIAASAAQCFDSRCAGVAGAYKTAAMAATTCKGQNLTCKEWASLDDGKYVAPGVPAPTGCEPAPPSAGALAWVGKHPLVLVAIILILIFVAFAGPSSSSSSGGEKTAPRLPLGALPPLPSLSEL